MQKRVWILTHEPLPVARPPRRRGEFRIGNGAVQPFSLDPLNSSLLLSASSCHTIITITIGSSYFATAMPRSRPRPSKLALTLSLFFLQTVAISASSSSEKRDSWRPDNELPGAKFVLGDGKNEGSKVKGYEGEWPLWASFRESKAVLDPLDAVAPAGQPSSAGSAGSGDNTSYVCAPIGECDACPDDVVSTASIEQNEYQTSRLADARTFAIAFIALGRWQIHLPYCRPYNNRRRVACSPVTNRNDPKAIQAALDAANAAQDSSSSPTSALLGWEACGKSARQEARDYFEMIVRANTISRKALLLFDQC